MSAEQDLLSSILTSDQPYPWEPLGPDGEAYLNRLEAELDDDAVVNEATTAGWQQVSKLLDSRWDQVSATPTENLLTTLQAQFQGRIPESALASIAHAATSWTQSTRPVAEQLVETVKAILPNWDMGDLNVLARPLAYSLRDGRSEVLDLTLRSAPQAEWESLSEIEKARLSLAIASVALTIAKAEQA